MKKYFLLPIVLISFAFGFTFYQSVVAAEIQPTTIKIYPPKTDVQFKSSLFGISFKHAGNYLSSTEHSKQQRAALCKLTPTITLKQCEEAHLKTLIDQLDPFCKGELDYAQCINIYKESAGFIPATQEEDRIKFYLNQENFNEKIDTYIALELLTINEPIITGYYGHNNWCEFKANGERIVKVCTQEVEGSSPIIKTITAKLIKKNKYGVSFYKIPQQSSSDPSIYCGLSPKNFIVCFDVELNNFTEEEINSKDAVWFTKQRDIRSDALLKSIIDSFRFDNPKQGKAYLESLK
ncbi:MAG TPA: hypothetical protein VGE63_02550 [Candidatus Paceibacterota bacterium]